MSPDLQKVANGTNAIQGYVETVRKFANINTSKHSEFMLIFSYLRIYFLEIYDFVEMFREYFIKRKGFPHDKFFCGTLLMVRKFFSLNLHHKGDI